MLAGGFLVLQAVLLLECVYATSEWLTDRPTPWRMAALSAARPMLLLSKCGVNPKPYRTLYTRVQRSSSL